MRWGLIVMLAGAALVAAAAIFVPRPAPPPPDAARPVDDRPAAAATGSPADDPAPAPEVPSQAGPDDAAAAPPPRFDLVRVEADGEALVAGTAGPAAHVLVLIDGVEAARARADAAGNFVALFSAGLSDRPRLVSLQVVADDGAIRRSIDTVILSPSSETLFAEAGSRAPGTGDAPDAAPEPADAVGGAPAEAMPSASGGVLVPDERIAAVDRGPGAVAAPDAPLRQEGGATRPPMAGSTASGPRALAQAGTVPAEPAAEAGPDPADLGPGTALAFGASPAMELPELLARRKDPLAPLQWPRNAAMSAVEPVIDPGGAGGGLAPASAADRLPASAAVARARGAPWRAPAATSSDSTLPRRRRRRDRTRRLRPGRPRRRHGQTAIRRAVPRRRRRSCWRTRAGSASCRTRRRDGWSRW